MTKRNIISTKILLKNPSSFASNLFSKSSDFANEKAAFSPVCLDFAWNSFAFLVVEMKINEV